MVVKLDPERLQQFARPLTARLAAQVIEPPDHVEVLEASEVLINCRILPGQADASSNLPRVFEHVDSGHLGAPVVRGQQGRQDAHDRGLARAVRTQ